MIKSIREARKRGVSDEVILNGIKKSNPERIDFLKDEAMAGATYVLEKIIKEKEKKLFLKNKEPLGVLIGVSLLIVSLFFVLLGASRFSEVFGKQEIQEIAENWIIKESQSYYQNLEIKSVKKIGVDFYEMIFSYNSKDPEKREMAIYLNEGKVVSALSFGEEGFFNEIEDNYIKKEEVLGVYFIKENGVKEIKRVEREIYGDDKITSALNFLLEGPTEEEKEKGYFTEMKEVDFSVEEETIKFSESVSLVAEEQIRRTIGQFSEDIEVVYLEDRGIIEKSVYLPILMYHHIQEVPKNASKEWMDLNVESDVFREQMSYLYNNGYNPITFENLLSFIEEGRSIPEKSLIITFDDGWRNQYSNAFPVLKEYNFPATFFIVIEQTGGNLFVSWSEIIEMVNSGMEIGSHTLTHPNLTTISGARLQRELEESKLILESKLGKDILSFSYPYGAFDARVLLATKNAGYDVARTVNYCLEQNLNELYNLCTIQVKNNLNQFKRIFPSL